MQKLLIVAAILVAAATSVFGLRCYRCTSVNAPTRGNIKCSDPLNVTYANATFMPADDCQVPPGSIPGCLKTVTNAPNGNGTIRACGFLTAALNNTCKTDTNGNITTTRCHCSGEYCNSALSSNSVFGSVTLLVFFALLMRAAY